MQDLKNRILKDIKVNIFSMGIDIPTFSKVSGLTEWEIHKLTKD